MALLLERTPFARRIPAYACIYQRLALYRCSATALHVCLLPVLFTLHTASFRLKHATGGAFSHYCSAPENYWRCVACWPSNHRLTASLFAAGKRAHCQYRALPRSAPALRRWTDRFMNGAATLVFRRPAVCAWVAAIAAMRHFSYARFGFSGSAARRHAGGQPAASAFSPYGTSSSGGVASWLRGRRGRAHLPRQRSILLASLTYPPLSRGST